MPKLKKETTSDEVVSQVEFTKAIVTQEKEIVKSDADIDGFIDLRQKFIAKVNAICVEGKDYHIIQGKKSLAKGGAEKIASIFKWTAKFDKDSEALEMLGEIKGLVAFKCTLMNGQFVGEGRGASLLTKNGGDPNKTLKMAQKSAFIDAVLRASGLSDFFTQDLEDMPKEAIVQSQQKTSGATEKQIAFIEKLMLQKKVTAEKLFNELDLSVPDSLQEIGFEEARKIIDWLIAYVPTFGEVTEEAKLFVQDLKDCDSIASYEKIKSEITLAKQNGKLSQYAWERIMEEAKKAVERLK